MSSIRVNPIKIRNYRSFGNEVQEFIFPDENYKKPVAIVGYNNSGKTNLMNAILYGTGQKLVTESLFPQSLEKFLEFEKINKSDPKTEVEESSDEDDDLPF